MSLRRAVLGILSVLIPVLVSCGGTPPTPEKKAEPVKPPEPVTGQYAFYQMYGVARAWIPDVEALQLRSLSLSEVPSVPGKAGAWEATFVSQSRGRQRTYTYSVVESSGNLHQGVFASPEEPYAGPRGQMRPFPAIAVKIDSDKAYEIALKHGADYARENPDMPISFLLEYTPRHNVPAWRVIWGESVSTSGFSVFVDSGAGVYLQTMG